ncbi:MAG: RND family transporter [Actinomycetes bacterium]
MARTIYRLSVPIILAWLAVVVALSTGLPSLDQVAREHAVSLNPTDAPSYKAALRVNESFKQPGAGNAAMILLEGEQPLGDDAHEYYNRLIAELQKDSTHVYHIQDFWGDPLTQGAAQSADGKAAYVQLDLAGSPGETQGNESVAAVRRIVDQTPAPPGVKTYVTGSAAIIADTASSGDRTIILITAVSVAVILTMLLLVYRSVSTVILLLLVVGIEVQVARGVVALLGHNEIIGLTTIAVNLLVSLAIAAGTDYGIFFIGRYQEARQAGEDRETAFYTTYAGVAKVVLASGFTIAGAVLCLKFTRLPYFQALAVPCAVGISVSAVVAVTLFPAVLKVGGRVGLFEPKRKMTTHGWRRIGTAIVRWPAPILCASLAVALLGILTLPGYKPSYNDQKFLPSSIPASQGIAAAARHYPPSTMLAPEVLLMESDHDLRNPADFLVLNKLAKAVLAVPGISKVQAVTRPQGTPIDHATIPYMLSMQQAGQQQFMHFQDKRMDDILKQADMLGESIGILQRSYGLLAELTATAHAITLQTHDIEDLTNDLRDDLGNFEDFWRPIKNYLYWEPHCYTIPICASIRSLFDAIDGVDGLNDKLGELVVNADQIDLLMPQILMQIPPTIEIMQSTRIMLLTQHSTTSGVFGQLSESNRNPAAMAKDFDAAKNDDSFYLPPEVFENEDFKRIMDVFVSPDGKAVRMLISQRGDPASPEGTAMVDAIKSAAEEALKGTPLENSTIYLAGTAALVKDLIEGSRNDLTIAVVAALCLIFAVMLIMTKSLVAAMVIVGTVLISLGASFGLSVLVWQYLLGIPIHWAVLVMSVIVLLAVGSDYNLLLVARMREEVGAGINTGIIRAMGGTGRVVTNAGLVFAFTMGSMVVSDLLTLGQLGTTIGLGLLFDTLVVRAFMTPSIAALLGRWFWWPQQVRPRPASSMLRPSGPRPLVRALLQGQQQ